MSYVLVSTVCTLTVEGFFRRYKHPNMMSRRSINANLVAKITTFNVTHLTMGPKVSPDFFFRPPEAPLPADHEPDIRSAALVL